MGKFCKASGLGGASCVNIIQITKVTFQGDRLLFDINGGLTSGRHWYDNIQGGMGGGAPMGGPVGPGPTGPGPAGPGGPSSPGGPSAQDVQLPHRVQAGHSNIGHVSSGDFSQTDGESSSAQCQENARADYGFQLRSAAQLYSEPFLPEMQKDDQRQDRQSGRHDPRRGASTILGQPDNPKWRETTKDGIETEDWIYGKPPGKMTFVTFAGSKVIKVKDDNTLVSAAILPYSTNHTQSCYTWRPCKPAIEFGPPVFLFTFTLAVSLASVPTQSGAQSWNDVKTLAAGTSVRISAGSHTVSGELQEVTDDSIAIESGKKQQAFKRQWMSRGSFREERRRIAGGML